MDLRPPPSAPASAFALQDDEPGDSPDLAEASKTPDSPCNAENGSLANSDKQDSAATPHAAESNAVVEAEGHAVAASTLADCLLLLQDNAAAIATAEEVLQHLLSKQSSLMVLERQLEQQRVLSVLQHPLGFHKGRPVAAILLFRCLQQWGLITADSAPVLAQLAAVLQQQLNADDESAPAEVAGLQCHVAYWLTVSAVLLCLLLKTTQPALAAAALQQPPPHSKHGSAAEVMHAKKKVGELQKQLSERVAHMGGLQALGKRFGAWGFSKQHKGGTDAQQEEGAIRHQASAPAGAAARADELDVATQSPAEEQAEAARKTPAPAGSAHTSFTSTITTSSTAIGAATASSPPAARAGAGVVPVHAPLQFFMLSLDQQVQRCFVLLRDQLKRRLTPLLADCMLNPTLQLEPVCSLQLPSLSEEAMTAAAEVAAANGEPPPVPAVPSPPMSPSAAGAAVAGTAAACAASAEPLLLNFRSWSELVGVLHAALVALRGAGVPRHLRAVLMQQVLEFVNCQLFNQLLLRPECCSSSNARYALRGLKQLDGWILAEQCSIGGTHTTTTTHWTHGPWSQSGHKTEDIDGGAAGSGNAGHSRPSGTSEGLSGWEEVETPADSGEIDSWQPPPAQRHHLAQLMRQQPHRQQQQQEKQLSEHEMGPEAWNALSHVRQALQFLVLEHKGSLSLEELSSHICPSLNHQQLYRLCTTAWDEAPGEDAVVSGEVLEEMKAAHTLSSNGGLIVTFLLDEPSGLPFVAPTVSAAASPAGHKSSCCTISRGQCKASAVVTWDDFKDYGAGMPLPAVLVDAECPAEVFGFVEDDHTWPWAVQAAAA